ncbi:MAG: methionyl-tRNA formyltransferase [Gammaproteobacteria bacterium]|nr:methionyl-tRNA formyltransferase [Gammaproteobacteria bacterium]
MTNPRIIFAGTPDFAVASLAALLAAGMQPCAVLTQPDRPAGRGKQLTPGPVKKLALQHELPLLQPATLRDDAVVEVLAALQADIMIVAAYGLILPQRVLDLPRAGCVNVHASLLPRWRGAAPIQAAILAGDKETGASLMSMDAGLDTGPVFASRPVEIGSHETAGALHNRVAAAGAALLVTHLCDIVAGRMPARQQDETKASYAAKIQTTDAAMDWQQPAVQLGRMVRAFNPTPGAWFMLGEERIKCWQARTVAATGAAPGTVIGANADGIVVACGDGALRLESLQRPGKRAVSAREFAAQLDVVGQQL